MIGKTVSHYRVVEKLGGGGMGVVYKAEDTRLGRSVALKFLPDSFANDRMALERFQREARAVSALNHPAICTIFDIGDFEGRPFMALELLEGANLRQRIAAKPLPLEETLEWAIQIAGALVAAHAKGIIHRDIKPANLFITTDGQAKVLDFGLAKQAGDHKAASSEAPTAAMSEEALTSPGSAVGTVAYMSPEQARGQAVDARTDLYSFGVVLYEMITGTAPFYGTTTAVIFDAILNKMPAAPTRLNPDAPAELERIILKALEKDRDVRYQTATDLLADLKRLRREIQSGHTTATMTVAAAARRRPVRLYAGAGVVLLAAAVVAVLVLTRSGQQPAMRLQWQQITSFTDSATSPALSPDGRMLTFIRGPDTFVGPGQIYVKMLPDGQPVRLTNDNLPKMSPVFSPDGSRIAYTVPWDTWVVPVLSGQAKLMLKNASGLVWTDPQHVLFAEVRTGWHMPIVTSTESRAESRDVYVPPDQQSGMAHRSYLSPDRKQVLLAEMDRTGWLPCRVTPLDGGSLGKQVGPAPSRCTDAAWSPDGKWMYLSADAGDGFHLWRQRGDGRPEQITFGPTEEEGLAVAPDGRSLITSAGTSLSGVYVHDAKGDRQVSSEGYAVFPSFSSDGKKVYYLASADRPGRRRGGELWAADLESGRAERLLPGVTMMAYDVSKDGKLVVYTPFEGGIWLAALDRGFPPRQLAPSGQRPFWLGSSGDVLYIAKDGEATYLYRMKQDASERRKVVSDPMVRLTSVSPDEQWVIVEAQAAGGVSVRAYPLRGGPPVPVCYRCRPRWTPDGKSLWFMVLGALMGAEDATVVVPLRGGAMLPPLPPAGARSREDLMALPGAHLIPYGTAVPGPTSSMYAFSRIIAQRNLYRIPL